MASSFFALLDDIATILDDVAVMTKVAAKKAGGVLGDDLALNAQQVSGLNADRELPVVWAVAKGSAINKLILVPAALLISSFLPWAVMPLLMIGGLFLCYEGCEKVFHALFHRAQAPHLDEHRQHLLVAQSSEELLQLEKGKIRGAVKTDFILSAEIIIITLGTVSSASLGLQVAVLSLISSLMTAGVYGLVAMIIKLDDLGLWLSAERRGNLARRLGYGILVLAPKLMKTLSVVGTAAMFLVGGGIIVHGVPSIHHLIDSIAKSLPVIGLTSLILEGGVGFVAGSLILGLMKIPKLFLRPSV